MLIVTVALYAFITFGLSSVFVELLKARGLSAEEAIAFGSSLGVIQVSARAIDFIGGDRWDGITTGLIAGSLLPVSMLVLLAGGGVHWSIVSFILIYGLGSGALAVARATMPLVFYDKAAFARTAYESAFLKLAYPAQFTVGLINAQPMGFYPVEVLVNDAKRHGVAVLPVDLNASRFRTTTMRAPATSPRRPAGCSPNPAIWTTGTA